MSDNKKYYYLKLKENFFDTDEMLILESMPEGITYSNILLKLYLRSLKNEGKLMVNERIPYNPQMISTIVRHPLPIVEKALNLFKELNLIDLLDNGAIYMTDIQNFIGKSSSEGDRKREYRKRIEGEKQQLTLESGQMSGQTKDKCMDVQPPEIELEKDIYSYTDELDVFSYWNESKAGTKHTDSTFQNNKDKIKTKIKKYGVEEIIKCIKRLSLAINDKSYYYSYKWSLMNFITQKNGLENWRDEGQYWVNYSEDSKHNVVKENKIERKVARF